MKSTTAGIAALLAFCLSVFSFGVQAACDDRAAGERSDSVAMGPDPGGKSGDTVTPDTTRTDHPAAERKEGADSSTGRSSANKAHDDSTGPTSGTTPQQSPRGEPDSSGDATR